MRERSAQAVPVTILTGFLGAGKTTLLNRILHADHGLRVAVLVNDFGTVNIDTQLVVGVEGETISLANGCICCSIRGDLLNTALQLLDRPEPPEYLLIETSGVSDPWAVVETFEMPELSPYFNLDSVITVVDAEYVLQQPHYENLIVDQVSAADMVVLSKVDLVTAEQRTEVEQWVRRIVPAARILPAVHGNVPLNLLLNVGRYKLDIPLARQPSHYDHEHDAHCDHDHEHGAHCDHDHHHDHRRDFDTWTYSSDRPFALKPLRDVVLNLPLAIFRAKGLIYLAEVPQRRAILQAVGHRVNVTLSEPWGELAPRTQLVFLSTPGDLDAAALQTAFDACLADLPAEAEVAAQQTWLRKTTV
ncbi:MAG: CobW family GTP-binding protein [Chloroflexaceae bacterium]